MSISSLWSISSVGCVSIALVFGLTPAFATDVTDGAASTASEFAQEQERAALKGLVRGQKPPATTLKLGVAYVDADSGGRRVSLPFELTHQTAHEEGSTGWWKYQLSGDGPVTVRGPGALRQEGFADLQLSVTRPLTTALLGTATLILPARGDIGSRLASQTLKFTYIHTWKPGVLRSIFVGAGSHFNSSRPGVSDTSYLLYGNLEYRLSNEANLTGHLARSHRQGTRTSDQIGADYDYQVTATKKIVIALKRVFAGAARSSSVQFSMIHNF